MSEALKPCPFCGSLPHCSHSDYSNGDSGWEVRCVNDECLASRLDVIANFAREADMAAAWNRRAALHDITHDIPAAMNALAVAINGIPHDVGGLEPGKQLRELHAELLRLSAILGGGGE